MNKGDVRDRAFAQKVDENPRDLERVRLDLDSVHQRLLTLSGRLGGLYGEGEQLSKAQALHGGTIPQILSVIEDISGEISSIEAVIERL